MPDTDNFEKGLIIGKYVLSTCAHLKDINDYDVIPDALLETVSKVVTPNVVLPATESTSIQKETQEMTTIKMVGK